MHLTHTITTLNKKTSLQLLPCFLYFYAPRKSIATILKPFFSKAAGVSTEVVILFKHWGSEFSSSIKKLRLPSAVPKTAAVMLELKQGEDR